MKKILLLLLISSSLMAQKNCDISLKNTQSKKLYKKALKLSSENRYKDAIFTLAKCLELQDDHVDAHALIARVYIELEDYQKAQFHFNKVIYYCPLYSSEMYWLLANLYFDSKEFIKVQDNLLKYLSFLSVSDEDKLRARNLIDKSKFFHKLYSNPVPYNPKIVPGVSTADDEYLPIISPDNDFLFYTRRKMKKSKSMISAERVEEFTVSSLKENSFFDEGKLMPYPFNLRDNEGGASLSIDNTELFLTICEKLGSYNNCDIYYTEYSKGVWQDLKRLKYPINMKDSWDSQPTISPDGNTLIFSSIREISKGGSDLYSVTRNEDGVWGDISSLNINTSGNEKTPFLHPDNQTLYFSSDGHMGLGGMDIFVCKKDSLGEWSDPLNIGYPINSSKDDLGLFVSTDGKTAYFASNKVDESISWNLYSFPLYNDVRPDKVLFVKGTVLDEDEFPLEEAFVEMKSLKTGAISRVKVDRYTGVYANVMTVDEDEDVIITVNSENKAFVSTYVSSKDDTFDKPVDLSYSLLELELGKSFKINNIYFQRDNYDLNEQSKIILLGFVEYLKNNTNIHISIHGHTDSDGSSESNMILSTNRARSVHDFIVSQGISKTRLSYEGFGDQKPVMSNKTAKGKSSNRRTEFYVTKK